MPNSRHQRDVLTERRAQNTEQPRDTMYVRLTPIESTKPPRATYMLFTYKKYKTQAAISLK